MISQNIPGPKARPVLVLKYLALWMAMRGAPSINSLEVTQEVRQDKCTQETIDICYKQKKILWETERTLKQIHLPKSLI